MSERTILFVDFWNFTLQWKRVAPENIGIDWKKIAPAFLARAQTLAGEAETLRFKENRIYASTELPREAKLKGFLDSFLDRQPGYRVFCRQRKARPKKYHCRNCDTEFTTCPNCKQQLVGAPEKGVDTAIATDMLSMAWQDLYDVAILVCGDADLVPAVEHVQNHGPKVINATWKNYGHELAKTCWAAFEINGLITV